MLLRTADTIDPEIEGYFLSFPLVEQLSTREHTHEFYEIFLIAAGSINHHVNGERVLLPDGALVFIRPEDRHCFHQHAEENCALMNLAFLPATFSALAAYLGPVWQHDALLNTPLPATVRLAVPEKQHLITQMTAWGRLMVRDKTQARLMLRAILAQVIAGLFVPRLEGRVTNAPLWLSKLCQQMQRKEHIVAGREALMQLANRTPEHVGRVFKAHLGVTPSQYVNDLRLDYAGDLLLHTDKTVIEICHEVGFNNLSHFYHLFKARWQCSPRKFRQLNRRTLIP